MHIIFLSSDRNLFVEHSAVHERFARFAAKYPNDTFESIVFSTRAHGFTKAIEIAPNMRAYPTSSLSRVLYGFDALLLSRSLSRPDIISSQDPFETGVVAALLSAVWKKPFVVEIHTDVFSPLFSKSSFLNKVRIWILGPIVRRADGGYCVSTKVRDTLARRFALRTHFRVLPIFVDTTQYEAQTKSPDAGQLLWVGRFAEEKRPEIALRACAAARALGKDVKLTMLGSGPLEVPLHQLAQKLGIGDYVSFPGWTDPKTYLKHAELILVTSAYEGYGMVIVEALAASVPVLAFDVGIAEEAGAVIVKKDFPAALIGWLNGPRERGDLKLAVYKNEDDFFEITHTFYLQSIKTVEAGYPQ
tara:strand:+ start:580348 stop:581424 length:1077 start_codon:yes stop_codon:yes gene_type:complete